MTTHIFSKLSASRRHPNMFAGLNTDGPLPGDVREVNTLDGLATRHMGLKLECGKCRMTGTTGDERYRALSPDQQLGGLRFSCTRCHSPMIHQIPEGLDRLVGLPVFPLTDVRPVVPKPVPVPPEPEPEEEIIEIPDVEEEEEDEEHVEEAPHEDDLPEIPAPAPKAVPRKRPARR